MTAMFLGGLILLFYLLCGHALADYVFQTDTVAREKSWKSATPLQAAVPWYYWLTAHALIHGGTVALITGHPYVGMAETLAHWIIDWAKIAGHTSIHSDQLLHFLCKVAWVLYLISISMPA